MSVLNINEITNSLILLKEMVLFVIGILFVFVLIMGRGGLGIGLQLTINN